MLILIESLILILILGGGGDQLSAISYQVRLEEIPTGCESGKIC